MEKNASFTFFVAPFIEPCILKKDLISFDSGGESILRSKDLLIHKFWFFYFIAHFLLIVNSLNS